MDVAAVSMKVEPYRCALPATEMLCSCSLLLQLSIQSLEAPAALGCRPDS